MRRARKSSEEKKGLDIWVMTYGDMMSLLLTFFILLVSFSSIQESKFRDAMISLQTAFGVETFPPTVVRLPEIVPPPPHAPAADVQSKVQELEQSLLAAGLDRQVDVRVTEKGVAFRIKAPFLFESGQADLRPAATALLDTLAGFLSQMEQTVRVEGHTDSVPIRTTRFPSNWELSAARAIAVARHFQGRGVPPARLLAAGYGEYRPVADNATVEGRERNRRVELFLEMKGEAPAVRDDLPLESEANAHGG